MSAQTETVQQPEQQSNETLLARVRHEFAQSHGLDVLAEAEKLPEDTKKALLEDFGSPKDAMAKALEDVDATGVTRNAAAPLLKRLSHQGLIKMDNLKPGETASLIDPITGMNQKGTNPQVMAASNIYNRGQAVKVAITHFTGAEDNNAQPYLDGASAAVYTSPHNGAPIITERIIEVPGAEIHEMNLHGAGSPATIDTQVIVVAK